MAARSIVLGVLRELGSRAPESGLFVAQATAEAVRARMGTRSQAGGLEIEVVTTDVELRRLAEPWTAIHEASGMRSPFATWRWLAGWWTAIGRAAGGALRLYVAREQGTVVGIAPTYAKGRTLRMLGETRVGSEHLDLIARDRDRPRVVAAMAAALREDAAVDAVDLVDVVEGSALAELVTAGAIGPTDETWQVLPYLPLPGSAAAWEASLSSNMRYNVRRKLKRLEKAHPGAHLRVIERNDELEDALTTLFRLHAARWATKGRTGNFWREEVRAFHREVAPPLLEAGILRLYQLELGGATAATLYCLRSGGREQYLQAGFDPAYEDVSAGFCLMAKVIARAADDGMREFDFLRGTESYKTHWATAERTTRQLRGARATPRGLAWLAGMRIDQDARAIAKAALPDTWRDRLKAAAHGR